MDGWSIGPAHYNPLDSIPSTTDRTLAQTTDFRDNTWTWISFDASPLRLIKAGVTK